MIPTDRVRVIIDCLSASEHRTDASIAAEFGVSTGTVWKLRQQVNGKPIPPKGTQGRRGKSPKYVALTLTPEQIERNRTAFLARARPAAQAVNQ